MNQSIHLGAASAVESWGPCQWLRAAMVSAARGDYAAAIAGCTNALRLEPTKVSAMRQLAGLYAQRSDLEGAIDWARQAVAASGGELDCVLELAGYLESDRDLDEAVAMLESLVPEHGDDARVLACLGGCRILRGELRMGEVLLRRAVALAPCAETRTRLGIGLWRLHRRDEALTELDRAVRDDPANLHSRFVRSHLLLELGDYARGYADREAYDAIYPPALRDRAWAGEPVAGRRVYMYAQHGLGDTLQYLRYVDLLVARGAIVTLAVQRPLLPLLRARSKAAAVIGLSDPTPDYDVQVRLMDMPAILGERADEVPCSIPYLFAEPSRVERLRPLIERLPRPRVGVCWRGNPQQKDGLIRSCELDEIARLGAAGVSLVSLQRGADTHELAARGIAWIPELDEDGPFLDTAAAITLLDLVVSIDTSVAHLAGGLGAEVLTLLPYWSDWRWRVDRSDTPWYPNMTLFRQQRPHEWGPAIKRVAARLARRRGEFQRGEYP